MVFAPRSCAELLQRQEQGTLRVCSALEFRHRAEAVGLEQAYADTDVVAAGSCGFTDQGQLWLSLGPSDPPLRLRQARLGGVGTSGGFGAGELCLPIGGNASDARRLGGAQVLDALLAGAEVPLELQGEATTLHPRRELLTTIQLERLNQARLLLARGISENGVVAVSSSEGLLASPFGGLLGPFGNALFNASGARSIGMTMPGLEQLGAGSAVLVAGAMGHVLGPGSGHQPQTRRQPSGHARAPGSAVALSVELAGLHREWLRPCWFEGHGAALLVAVAAPVLLLGERQAAQAAVPDSALEAPVLDFSIPRRIRPGFGTVSYRELLAGRIQVDGQQIPAAPSCSLSLGDSHTEALIQQLLDGRFPLPARITPLSQQGRLHPLEG
jgi:uncharacterized protein (DUF39 family)